MLLEEPCEQVNRAHNIALAFLVLMGFGQAQAQNRGVYPLGMSATNSGVTPDAGFTFVSQLLYYARDSAKDNDGGTLPATGEHAVVMYMTTLAWVGDLPKGFQYSIAASLPIATNSLTSDVHGNLNGGTGFADSYFMPLIAAWTGKRVALRLIYGFLAPTGRFAEGATDNVGSGYWTHAVSSGQTFYPLLNKRIVLSAFEMYEFHSVQAGTDISPGQTFDLDYSALGVPIATERFRLSVGIVGYEQRQTTATSGPGVSEAATRDRYLVNSVGAAVSATFPKQKASLGVRWFQEFLNRSTFEGFSVQIAAAITF